MTVAMSLIRKGYTSLTTLRHLHGTVIVFQRVCAVVMLQGHGKDSTEYSPRQDVNGFRDIRDG